MNIIIEVRNYDNAPASVYEHDAKSTIQFNQPSHGWVKISEPNGVIAWYQLCDVKRIVGKAPINE